MVNDDRQRQYLAALGISSWQLRRPLAVAPTSGSAAPVATPEPAPPAAPESEQPNAPVALATALAGEGVTAADWTSPMDDDQESLLETTNANHSLASLTPDSRTARIARLDWEQLAEEVRQCTACGLCSTRTQTVFGVGNRQAKWLIIGEAPGADEDQQGEPFVGRAGKLLNPMLLAIGLKREQVFIANILKCRPPENRDPTSTEAASCRPFLERQIELIRPRIILAVGRIAAQNLLATDTQIGKLRGRVHRFGPARLPLIVTYHPAYLLRSPREKRKSWDDLRLAQRTLAAEPYDPAWRSAAP